MHILQKYTILGAKVHNFNEYLSMTFGQCLNLAVSLQKYH